MPRTKERCRCRHRRPTTTYLPSDDDDDDSHDDIDLDDDEIAEILAKEARRRELKRAAKARYRARHPEQVAAQKRRYRARYPEKVTAQKQRYRERYRAKVHEVNKRYYAKNRERLRAYYKQRDQTEHRRAWRAQYRVKRRKALAERRRTAEEIKSLGPLKLNIELEDCLKPANIPVETYLETFCQSLEVDDRPQPSFCELLDDSYTLTDLDLGERRPVDPPVWEQWLDDLLDDLSMDLSFDDLSRDSDLSSDDLSSLCDLLPDEWAQPKEDFDLDDFVS